MPDFSKWGISPDDVGGDQPTQSMSEPDFNTKWLGEKPAPSGNVVKTTTETPSRTVQDQLLGTTGPRYQTWPERLLRTIAPSIGQGLAAPGSALKSTPENPVTTGEMIGPVANLAGVIGTGAIPSVYGPAKALIEPATASLANLARQTYGIPIRGGQISESPAINYLDSVLKSKYGSGYGASEAAQHAGFNRAVAETIGETADKLTPEVMANAKSRLGQNYEDIARATTLKIDEPLNQRFNDILAESGSVLRKEEHSIINKQVQGILDKVSGSGEINGQQFQAMIKTGSPLDRATKSSDTNVKHYAGEIKSALLDAMNRHAPEDMQALLKQTNRQYKNMKTIEDLVEKSPTGDISPALLMGAVRKSYSNMAYGGGGDIADLARIGQRFLKEPPQSGTAPRFSAGQLLGLGGIGGGELAVAFHDPVLAAKLAAVAGTVGAGKAAMNKTIGSILRSDWYANRLINSALPQGAGPPNMMQKLTASNVPYLPPAAASLPMLPLAMQQ